MASRLPGRDRTRAGRGEAHEVVLPAVTRYDEESLLRPKFEVSIYLTNRMRKQARQHKSLHDNSEPQRCKEMYTEENRLLLEGDTSEQRKADFVGCSENVIGRSYRDGGGEPNHERSGVTFTQAGGAVPQEE